MKEIGPTNNLPPEVKRAFEPFSDFEPVPSPGPNDWLSVHMEPGQTFTEYVRSGPFRPDKNHSIIYLQPVGEFEGGQISSLALMELFAEAFFCVEVKVIPTLYLEDKEVTSRINVYTGKKQILTLDVLDLLHSNRPPDAYCVLAVTMEDLYPAPSWNFVFGQASIRDGVGVFSFARYDPRPSGEPFLPDEKKLFTHRYCKVLAHETCHMLGLLHCIYYHCLMNGSNHIEESDGRPMHLCPVCLRKLYHSIDFDIPKRYAGLIRFYKNAGLYHEAEWTKDRLSRISE
jgi:archaemetzincin